MSAEKAPKDEEQIEQEAEKSPKTASGHKSGGHGHKKVSHMTLAEIDAALAEIGEKMGGFHSSHAMFLLARREYLLKYTAPQPLKKAA